MKGGQGVVLGFLVILLLENHPMKIYYDPKSKIRCRELRKKRVLSEVLPWSHLKGRKIMGYQFARQKPIGHTIVDFYCPALRLIIEIDGESHRERFEEDRDRQKDLEAIGLHLMRFTDRKVKQDMSNVLRCIEGWVEEKRRRSSES